MTQQYVFETTCVGAGMQGAEAITEMVDNAREVTWGTIKKHISANELKILTSGYTTGLRLQDDYTVSFWKSKYRGRPCYFIVHSAIEYVFVKRGRC